MSTTTISNDGAPSLLLPSNQLISALTTAIGQLASGELGETRHYVDRAVNILETLRVTESDEAKARLLDYAYNKLTLDFRNMSALEKSSQRYAAGETLADTLILAFRATS